LLWCKILGKERRVNSSQGRQYQRKCFKRLKKIGGPVRPCLLFEKLQRHPLEIPKGRGGRRKSLRRPLKKGKLGGRYLLIFRTSPQKRLRGDWAGGTPEGSQTRSERHSVSSARVRHRRPGGGRHAGLGRRRVIEDRWL